jgi:monoamine oxidase
MTDSDILIIGAGMAGLTAARALAEAGLKVTVVEARDRVGGRILTRHVDGHAIELGAEFIHGRPAELWALITEAGVEPYERDGSSACYRDGSLERCDEYGGAFDLLEQLENRTEPDTNFAQYLSGVQATESEKQSLRSFVEGFNAADAGQISVASLGAQQKAEDSIHGDLAFSLPGGYDRLAEYLAESIHEHGGKIQLNLPVREVSWSPSAVQVSAGEQLFNAPRVIVTVPLGVLQSGGLVIHPHPAATLLAASQMRMGHAIRFTLRFREPFWERMTPVSIEDLSFLFSFEEMPPVWWTTHPHPSSLLTGWVGGPRSKALSGLGPEELAAQACSVLAHIFSVDISTIRDLLLDCHTHDWSADPYSVGAYSYVAAGGIDAPRQLSEPVANTLFFAGEHTDTTAHWGTVHAAIRSGLRVAQQILNSPD